MANRIPKLTDRVSSQITSDLAAGLNRVCAAMRAGVKPRTMRHWLTNGRRNKGKVYVAFLAAVEKAEMDAQARNVAIIQKAASKQWTAAAWWLERKFPDQWGKRDRMELTGNRKKPVEVVEVVVSSREQADEILARNDPPE